MGSKTTKRYDFSASKPNPYVRKIKRQVTIRLDEATIEYFKGLSAESGIPYQNLINLYLRECAATGKRLKMEWASQAGSNAGRAGKAAR